MGKLKVIDGKLEGMIFGLFEGFDDGIELSSTFVGIVLGFMVPNPIGIRASVGLTLDKVGISVGASVEKVGKLVVGLDEGFDVLGLKLGLDGFAVGVLLGKPDDGRRVGSIEGAGPTTVKIE